MRTLDFPLFLGNHTIQQRNEWLSAHHVSTRHLCHSLLKRNFILDFTMKLDLWDLIQGNFLLNDHIFECQYAAHLLPIFDSLIVYLEHHFLRSQKLADFCVYLLLKLYTSQSCIDVDLCYLFVCKDEKCKRDTLWDRITFFFNGEDNRFLLSCSHCKN